MKKNAKKTVKRIAKNSVKKETHGNLDRSSKTINDLILRAIDLYIENKASGQTSKHGRALYGSWVGPHKDELEEICRKVSAAKGYDVDDPVAYGPRRYHFSTWVGQQAKKRVLGIKSKRDLYAEHFDNFISLVGDGVGVIIGKSEGKRPRYVAVANVSGRPVVRFVHATTAQHLNIGDRYTFTYSRTDRLRSADGIKLRQAMRLLNADFVEPSTTHPTDDISQPETKPEGKAVTYTQTRFEENYSIALSFLKEKFKTHPYSIDKEVNLFLSMNPEASKEHVIRFLRKSNS